MQKAGNAVLLTRLLALRARSPGLRDHVI
jgi:hypothetical protein